MAAQNRLLNCLDQKHSIDIIMALGAAQRARRRAIMSDVVSHSENGKRCRQKRLHELIDYGLIRIIPEWKHPHNTKPLELTPLGWNVYAAISRCIQLSEVI